MNYLIGKYIENISITNINQFAQKNNIFLTENEQNIFLDIIKNHYQEILTGNDGKYIAYLKANLNKDTFTKVISLYNLYKEKYQNYL